ncbi:MAG TPA: sugar ABC transporter permease [Solirubrobacteraceae bacterium]|nr:sugar ABC transporter permease [Solirubrobacteraceae bacterium]
MPSTSSGRQQGATTGSVPALGGGRRQRRPGWLPHRKLGRPLLLPYLFVAPAVVFTALFSILPLVILFRRSFLAGGIFATHLSWVGLQNYTNTLSQGGGQALKVTAIFTVAFIVLTMGFGLGIALLLDMKLPGVKRLRAPFIIPLAMPSVATALIWATLFAPQIGLINRILSVLGIPQADFTSSPSLAMVMILSFGTWQFFGQNVILYLAALKNLPVEIMEQSSIDGAGAWQRFWHIRLPLLQRNTILILVITTLTGLQTFNQIYVLTNGGPNGATTTALFYVYNQGFVQFNTGQADAMAVILFLISLVITVGQVGILGRRAHREI